MIDHETIIHLKSSNSLVTPPLRQTMNNQIKQQFDDQGHVFCSCFQTPSQVEEINTQLERVIQTLVPQLPAEHVFYEDKADRSSLKQIQNLQIHDSYFGQLMFDGPFRRLAERLLGSEVVCQNMQFFNKPPATGQPTPAHQDGYYFKLNPCEALTMWMALEAVDEENGCVRYIPRFP